MKRPILLVLLAINVSVVGANLVMLPSEWSATVQVLDENNQPIPSAHVAVGYTETPTPDQIRAGQFPINATIEGETDAEGRFKATHRDVSTGLGISAEKAGYYKSLVRHEFPSWPGQYDPETARLRRNPTVTVVLKKIIVPVAMYVRRINERPPAKNTPVGYDLTMGDWAIPYGKGHTSDLFITWTFNKRSPHDLDCVFSITFPNAGDGIKEFSEADTGDRSSALKSPHEAPLDGYQSKVERDSSVHPGEGSNADYDANRGCFFRVRTAMDEKGQVTSALYGKIYGDLMEFTYYLNPTPNDRNVEFDPKQNLFTGLKSFERVSAP
jgi:hypothetical protein